MEDIRHIEPRKGPKPRRNPVKPIPEVMNEEDLYDFGKKYPQPWRCLFYLTYLTGGRISEVLELRRKDMERVDFEDTDAVKVTLITRKNRANKFRAVPIPTCKMLTEVMDYIDTLPKGGESYLFQDIHCLKGGRSKAWRMFAKEHTVVRATDARGERPEDKYLSAYVLRMRPHYLRHCRLTHLVNRYGVDSLILMFFAGWTTPAPARVYASADWQTILKRMTDRR
jgi:integrase